MNKPSTLGRINGKTVGEQIQEFMRVYAQYKRQHATDGVQISHVDQSMEEDIDMLQTTGLFDQDKQVLLTEDFPVLKEDSSLGIAPRGTSSSERQGDIIIRDHAVRRNN
jgi:hypothetical protein